MSVRVDQLVIKASMQGQDVVAGSERINSGLDKINATASKTNSSLGRMGNYLGIAVGAEAARRVIEFSGEMAEAHSRSRALELSFRSLASRQSLNPIDFMLELGAATNATKSEMELFALSNKSINSGIKTLYEGLPEILENVRSVSTSLGRNAATDIDRVIEAIIKREQELLDELGIVARVDSANAKYAQTLGVLTSELTELQQREAFAVLVTEELRQKAEAVGRPINEQADATARWAAAWENFKAQAGGAVEPIAAEIANLASGTLEGVVEVFDANTAAALRFKSEVMELKQLGAGEGITKELTRNHQLLNMRSQILDTQNAITGHQRGDDFLRGIKGEQRAISELANRQKDLIGIRTRLAEIAEETLRVEQMRDRRSTLRDVNKLYALNVERDRLERNAESIDEERQALDKLLRLWGQLDRQQKTYNEAARPTVQRPAVPLSTPAYNDEPDTPDTVTSGRNTFQKEGDDYQAHLAKMLTDRKEWQAEIILLTAEASGKQNAVALAEIDMWEKSQTQRAMVFSDSQEEINVIQQVAGQRRNTINQQATQQRVAFEQSLTRATLQASNDRLALAQFETDQWAKEMAARATTLEELMKLNDIYNNRKASDLANAEREKSEDHIRRILLVFDADASRVEDASDLANYSLGLFVNTLHDLSPALSMAIDGVHQVVSAALSIGENGKLSFNSSTALAAGGGFAVTTAMSMMAADSAKWKQEVERLNNELADAESLTGAYARSLESLNIAQSKDQFRDLANSLPEQLGRRWDQVDWLQFVNLDDFTTDMGLGFEEVMKFALSDSASQDSYNKAQSLIVKSTFEQLERIGEGIRRFSGETFTFGQAMDDFNHAVRLDDIQDPIQRMNLLTQSISSIIDITSGLNTDFSALALNEQRNLKETIADLQRDITQTEIEAREEYGQTVIAAIQQQQGEIDRALDDALDAQRQATLRSVRLQFDLQEASLRQRFSSRLVGAGGDSLEVGRIATEMQREIEMLRLAETATGTAELSRLREAFESERQQQSQASELLIEAVESAAKITGVDMSTAITNQTNVLLAGWAESLSGTVLGKPVLPENLIDLQQSVRLDMSTLLEPVGVRPVDLAFALEPFGVKDIDLVNALRIQGVVVEDANDLIDIKGVSIVDLASALSLEGQQTVDLAKFLRVSGTVDVPATKLVNITGTAGISANNVLEMSGVSTQMNTMIDHLDTIRSYAWATQDNLYQIRQDGLGGGSVDLSQTNNLLRYTAQVQAAALRVELSQKSVLGDLDINSLGGFEGWLGIANLISSAPSGSGSFGGQGVSSGGGTKEVIIRFDSPLVEVNVTGGTSQDKAQIKRMYKDSIEPEIINSANDGALRQVIRRAAS